MNCGTYNTTEYYVAVQKDEELVSLGLGQLEAQELTAGLPNSPQ
jgi:hypothetical protein